MSHSVLAGFTIVLAVLAGWYVCKKDYENDKQNNDLCKSYGQDTCEKHKSKGCTWKGPSKDNKEGACEYSKRVKNQHKKKKVKGGGKAQLRAMRDAIRQYEAQSGERQLAARRSFNQAKRQMAARS